MSALARTIRAELDTAVPPPVVAAARLLADWLGGCVVLFYGSVLRTGDLDGVLDFYVLTRQRRTGATARLWPDVSFHEIAVGGATLRAKVATMPLATFRAAADGGSIDTTVWTRFVQPARLVWAADPAASAEAVRGVTAAAITAARFAAGLGPESGIPADFWRALFRQTYAAELRVEKPGREEQILATGGDRWNRLLPLAWAAGGIGFDRRGEVLMPRLAPAARRTVQRSWRRRRRLGRPLNAARLVKAAFTFEGAARYGLWKIERHTGLYIPLTPWRERHPVLAAPAVLWRVWRAGGTR